MVMLRYILMIMLAFIAADAHGRSAGFTQNNWSVLSLPTFGQFSVARSRVFGKSTAPVWR
jgi:hypothetical protein